jgi:hypothetical protein
VASLSALSGRGYSAPHYGAVDVVRPASKNTRSPFQQPFTGDAIYGDVLRSTESCVYAAVRLGSDKAESRTHCFRGRVPSDAPTP